MSVLFLLRLLLVFSWLACYAQNSSWDSDTIMRNQNVLTFDVICVYNAYFIGKPYKALFVRQTFVNWQTGL